MNIKNIPTKLLLEESKYRKQREIQFLEQLIDTKDQLAGVFFAFFFQNVGFENQIRKMADLGRLLQDVEKTGEFASVLFGRSPTALGELHIVADFYFEDYNKAEIEKRKLEAVREIRSELHGRNEEASERAILEVFSIAFDELILSLIHKAGKEDPTTLKGGFKGFVNKFK